MKLTKQIISMVLLLAILFGMFPATVQAEEASAAVENTGATIEGTNGFGALLSQELQEQQEADAENTDSGYNVIGLKIEDGIATAEYSSLEEAILVVSLYTEDGVKMLLSGKTAVSPEETVANVQLDGEIPEYFMASAFLLDTYDHSPLCTSYETPMYTKEMQELLASTVDDYDADKVLQLDDDTSTNFAVYADSTIVLEYAEGVNTVVSANDETLTYVIENADSTVLGLLPGNILAYAYGEEQILIVKVATIAVDGTTVTITGTDVEIEEVFSHMKIEEQGNTADMTVDETSGDEDVSFVGMVENGTTVMSLSNPYGVSAAGEEGEVSGSVSAGFEVEKESGSNKLTASLLLNVDLEFNFYITKKRQFTEFKATATTKLSLEVSGKASYPIIKLKTFSYSPVLGVSIEFKPTISFVFSAKVAASISATETIGFSYDSTLTGKKTKDLTTSPKVDFSLDMEGTIFFGLDMAPTLKVLKGWVLEASLSAEAGIEITAENDGIAFGDFTIVGNGETPESIHNCKKCLKIDVYLKLETGVSLKFLKVFTAGRKFEGKSCSLGQWYWSMDRGEFKKGTCPNLSHRVTVSVSDANSKRVAGSAVTATREGQSTEITIGTTNSSGTVANYLPAGNYTFTAWVQGEPVRKTAKISGPGKITLNKEFITNGPPSFTGSVNPDTVTDYGQVIASGECGDKGNNVLWSLSSGGLLKIFGQGAMAPYASPWKQYRSLIKKAEICDGVTTIDINAFHDCTSLTSVTIPDSVTTIGEAAFYSCTSLTSVTIPDSVTTIGERAFCNSTSLTSVTIGDSVESIGSHTFAYCDSLTSIWVDEDNTNYSSDDRGVLFNKDKTVLVYAPCGITSYTIPDSVTCIGSSAFYSCTGLTSVTIPDSVTTIDEAAFQDCTSLTRVTIPDSVTTIGNYAFGCCFSLTRVTIPDSVTTIGEAAFYSCTGLTSVTIPDSVTTVGDFAFADSGLTSLNIGDSVTTIGAHAFQNCNRLTSVTIPDSVTTISDYAFLDCTSLTRITIPDSVTTIGNYAFYWCYSLTSVTIGDSVTTIGTNAFYHCNRLTSITIPDSVTTIGTNAFYDCTSLTSVTIPDSVTTIGNKAFYHCNSLTDVYYGGTKQQWNAISIGSNNSCLTNATLHIVTATELTGSTEATTVAFYEDDAPTGTVTLASGETLVYKDGGVEIAGQVAFMASSNQDYLSTGSGAVDTGSFASIFDGEYETEITDTYILKKATFSGLVPGEQYVLLSLVSVEVEDALVPENLLYIDQAAAAEDGTLVFAYAQRENTDISYVMACGASNQNLKDAIITFPSMAAKEEIQAVHPNVAYDGKELVEGVDYVLTGTVDYTKAGEYTCYIRGIYDYTGLVKCTYMVIDATASVTTEKGLVYYETVEEALSACSADCVLELQRDVEADITVSQNMLLNLNGFDITGNVTANSDAEFAVMDSQTDDYTVEDEFGYGKITGTVSGITAQDGYLLITEDDGTSFHRVVADIAAMSLRTSVAGIYYECDFLGDEVVARNVQCYGVVLSVCGEPTEVERKNSSIYHTFNPGSAGNIANGTLLTNVLKTSNTDEKNASHTAMGIYGRGYLQTKDGRYLFGSSRVRSFQEQVELVDQQWLSLTEEQKASVVDMYSTYQKVMESWNIPNIQDAA